MIFRSFLTFFAIGTRVAILFVSTWFHKPIEGAAQRFSGPARRPFYFMTRAQASTSAFNSPLSNISIMMSDPPTNSPFT